LVLGIGAVIFVVVAALLTSSLIRFRRRREEDHREPPQVYGSHQIELAWTVVSCMVFFVAVPLLFGFANYLVPLMIGARDLALPRVNAFGFWLTLWGGLLLYLSYVAGEGLYGAGSAPDVGWFAYAPLTGRAFSPGHSTDYWNLALLLSGVGTIALTCSRPRAVCAVQG